ncbi:DinB family protein [Winogradskyella wandonensis]|uniref:DinB family protein n=1 Tax=Winogradskyella wandonensis TaxID=1442586 RepID=A0A4R1KVK6_9FLAO|nr:DinB family protein [Winogradskyella wandonensis]TCK69222.1 DinB family protein [Winogradskyella wandonensis]
MDLLKEEYNAYYQPYINLTTNKDVITGLKDNLDAVVRFYKSLPKAKEEYAYAEGKWTPKDILLHIIDTERIFSYRALRIARGDKTEMAGFEQDDYVLSGEANKRDLKSLIKEYIAVRNSTITLFNSFNDEALKALGKASGSNISVRAIGYIITGHENHHNKVIQERYL